MRYLAKRILLYIPITLLVTMLVFVLMRVIPGDPALLIRAGRGGSYMPKDLANLRHELGTDQPLSVQYGRWMWRLLHGDLGTSLFFRTPITKEIGPRIPPTLELAFLAVFISFIVAVPLGAVAAGRQDHVIDHVVRVFSLTGISVPIFVTGLVLRNPGSSSSMP